MVLKARFRVLAMAVVGCSVLSLSGYAHSQVINGSFEAGGGSFSGWSTIGDAQIQGNSLGSGPTDGSWQALLATATDGTVNPNVVPGIGVGPAALEPFLGLNSGSLLNVGNGTPLLGSAVFQQITGPDEFMLTFDWDFLTNQTFNDGSANSLAPSTVNNDFAFVSIFEAAQPSNQAIFILADTFYGYVNDPNAPGGFQTGFTITDPNNPFISETGFNNFTLNVTGTAGQYGIGVGVVHVTTGPDNGVNSGLLVDNFTLTPVPEPASIAVLGALALGVMRRRSRKVQN